MSEPLRLTDLVARARARGVDRLDAQLLLCHVLGDKPRSWLLAHDQDDASPETAMRFHALIERRAEGEPLAYILGHKEFHGLMLQVSPGVLVPRPDTETLVDWALSIQPGPRRVLDLGTGSGAIALALARQLPQAEVVAVDASPVALEVAGANARALGLRLDLRPGHWWDPLATSDVFDLIVSNPPYIAEGDPHLPDLRHEPREALTSGPDGLDDLRQIVGQASAHLRPGGWLLLEHGHDQAPAVQALLTAAGFRQVQTRHDLGGQPRCTGGTWGQPC